MGTGCEMKSVLEGEMKLLNLEAAASGQENDLFVSGCLSLSGGEGGGGGGGGGGGNVDESGKEREEIMTPSKMERFGTGKASEVESSGESSGKGNRKASGVFEGNFAAIFDENVQDRQNLDDGDLCVVVPTQNQALETLNLPSKQSLMSGQHCGNAVGVIASASVTSVSCLEQQDVIPVKDTNCDFDIELEPNLVMLPGKCMPSGEEQCQHQQGDSYDRNGDCSMESTAGTEWKPSKMRNEAVLEEAQSSGSEESASSPAHSQPLQQRKKRIDLQHQFVREIVKIQHGREQYDRQMQAQQPSGNFSRKISNAGQIREHRSGSQAGKLQLRKESEKTAGQRMSAIQRGNSHDKLAKESHAHDTISKESTSSVLNPNVHSSQGKCHVHEGSSQHPLDSSEQEGHFGGNHHRRNTKSSQYNSKTISQLPSTSGSFSVGSDVVEITDESDFSSHLNNVASYPLENSTSTTSNPCIPSTGSVKLAKERGTFKVLKSSSGEHYVHSPMLQTEHLTPEGMNIKVTLDTHKQQRHIEFVCPNDSVLSSRQRKYTEFTSPITWTSNEQASDLIPHDFSIGSSVEKYNNYHPPTAYHTSLQGSDLPSLLDQNAKRMPATTGWKEFLDQTSSGPLIQSVGPLFPFSFSNQMKAKLGGMLTSSNVSDKGKLVEKTESGFMREHGLSRRSRERSFNRADGISKLVDGVQMTEHAFSQTPWLVSGTMNEKTLKSASGAVTSVQEIYGNLAMQHSSSQSWGATSNHTKHEGNFVEVASGSFSEKEMSNESQSKLILQNLSQTAGRTSGSVQIDSTSIDMLPDETQDISARFDRGKGKRHTRLRNRKKDHAHTSKTHMKGRRGLNSSQTEPVSPEEKENDIDFSQSTSYKITGQQGKHGSKTGEKLHDTTTHSIQVPWAQLSYLHLDQNSVHLSGKWGDVSDDSSDACESFQSTMQWNAEKDNAHLDFANSQIQFSDSINSHQKNSEGIANQVYASTTQKINSCKEGIHRHSDHLLDKPPPRKNVWERLGPQNPSGASISGPLPKVAGDLSHIFGASHSSSNSNMRSSFKAYAHNASGFSDFLETSSGQQNLSLWQDGNNETSLVTSGIKESKEVVVQAYKDTKQKRSKRELYVPRRGFFQSSQE